MKAFLTPYLVDDGIDLTYKGIPFAFPQSFGRTLFVNPSGNNATAVVGRIDKPYATISAAIAASLNGDSIWVFAGTYTEQIVISAKTNLSFYLFDVTLTHSGVDANELIRSDNTNLVIHGFGRCTFNRTNQAIGGTYPYAFSLPGSSALTMRNVTVNGNLAGILPGNGEVKLEHVTISAGTNESIKQNEGNLTAIRCNFSTGAGQNNVYVGTPTGGWTAKFERCKFSGAATYSLRITGGTTAKAVFLDSDILSATATAIRSDGNGFVRFEGCYINSFTHVEIVQTNAGFIFKDCTIVGKSASRAVWFYVAPADYTCEFVNTKIIASGTYSIDNASATSNKINMINCYVNKATLNVAGVVSGNITDANLKDLR